MYGINCGSVIMSRHVCTVYFYAIDISNGNWPKLSKQNYLDVFTANKEKIKIAHNSMQEICFEK